MTPERDRLLNEVNDRVAAALTPELNTATAMAALIVVGKVLRDMRAPASQQPPKESKQVNREAFRRTIGENRAWLRKQPRTLERDHIDVLLQDCERLYYPPEVALLSSASQEREKKAQKDGAGLICQTIPDVEGTEPRPGSRRVCNYGTHKWLSWEREGAGHVRRCRRCPATEAK